MPIQPSSSPAAYRQLPEQPDLDQLKRHAKELLRDHAAGKAEAVAQIQSHFRVNEESPLTLAQAQLVLARSYGFDSWPKLKAYVDGVNTTRLFDAVRAGDSSAVAKMLLRRPELANAAGGGRDEGERRLIHWAVIQNDASMLRTLMQHGADARIGIWPHRESTTAFLMAKERGYDHLVEIINEEEAERREELSCPNITISPEMDKLAKHIAKNKTKEAITMLRMSPDLIKQCDRTGSSPLHLACERANEELASWLCDRGASARKIDAKGLTPIDRAALSPGWREQDRIQPSLGIMRRLLIRGCELTPLAAAALGEIEKLQELHAESPARLTEGFAWNRGGLLTTAVKFGQIKSVRCLLDLGLNPDEPISLGNQEEEEWSWGGPLWHAAAFGHIDIARLLLDREADPNANVYASGWPLDRAYERGDRAMVDLLYERGAKPSAYTVCSAHDVEAARRMLEEEGSDLKLVRELVWSAACCTSLPIIKLALPLLLELGSDSSPVEMDWHDLLSQPMRIGEPSEAVRPADYHYDDRFIIMQMMLDGGANPNALGRFGLTLLHFIAARDGAWMQPPMPTADRNRFATLLLDAGADPSLRDQLLGSSALGWACRYARRELVELLLERGAPAIEPDAEPWATPLAWAKKMGHSDIEKRLLNHGAIS